MAVPASAIAVEPVVPCFVAPLKDLAVDVKFDCGYVVVPENSAAPAGRRVKLGYLRLKARASGSAAKAPPLFVLAGDPGSSLIQQATFALFAALGPLLDERDVVILDQRGTAHTRPHLDCPDAPRPVTSGALPADGIYSLEFIEPGLQRRTVKVYRTRDAAEMLYQDTIPLDRGGFQVIVICTRNPSCIDRVGQMGAGHARRQ